VTCRVLYASSRLGVTSLLREGYHPDNNEALGNVLYSTGGLPVGCLRPPTAEVRPVKSRGLNPLLVGSNTEGGPEGRALCWITGDMCSHAYPF